MSVCRYRRLSHVAVFAVLIIGACTLAGHASLETVTVPQVMSARARPLDDYSDRLLDELARVIATPDLPSTERVVVVCSPKIELMFLVAGLASDWQLMHNLPADSRSLQKSAAEYFTGHSGHEAVTTLAGMRGGFWYDALPRLALLYSDPPRLEQVYPLSKHLIDRAGGSEETLSLLMRQIRDFAHQSDFRSWWSRHEAEYLVVEKHCRELLASYDPLGDLEAYFGERLAALVVLPSGLIGCGFGGTIEDPLGSWAINCFGAASGRQLPDAAVVELLVYHEGGHAFVNHHADDHCDLAMRYRRLYDPISEQMETQAYDNWITCLNEHVLRACHARLELANHGEEAAQVMLSRDEGWGFSYVRALYEQLAVYEADRATYPDFSSFYPLLLQALDQFL